MKDVQRRVDEWIQQYKIGYFKPLEITARLAEETGEVAREINARFGPKKKKESEDVTDLEEEVGDMIFTLACLSNSLGLDMQRGFDRAMDKCYGRDSSRFEKKDS